MLCGNIIALKIGTQRLVRGRGRDAARARDGGTGAASMGPPSMGMGASPEVAASWCTVPQREPWGR